ncbi:MAG: hypothetical protein WCO65_01740 [bacterium]
MEKTNLNSGPKIETAPQRESLEEFLKKSGLEHVPKIETTFFFNTHDTKEDGEKVIEFLKQGDFDIFAPEAAGWGEFQLDSYKKASNGILNPDDFDNQRALEGKERIRDHVSEYSWAIFQGIYNSKKEILFIDVPEENNQKLVEVLDNLKLDFLIHEIKLPSMNFEDAKRLVIEAVSKSSNAQMEREDYILENFYKTIADALKHNPDLQKKANIKMLASMGAFHTRLYHEMKKNNDVARVYDRKMPYVYSADTALHRNMHFFGPESFGKHAYKYILDKILIKLTNVVSGEELQKAVTTFSEDQTKELFELYKNKRLDENCNEELAHWIQNELKK